MSIVRRDATLRWSAVVVGLGLVAAAPALVGALPVPSSGLTGRQVLDRALASDGVAYSGLAEVTGRLGLPTLPFASDGVVELDQTTRVRVWYASPTSWRTDALLAGGQREEFATADGTRQFDYESDTVTTRLRTSPGLRLPRTADLMPAAAARLVLSWAGTADRVEALPARRLAGVAAAGARVTPTDGRTSVGRIDVWVDPADGLPLELDLYARGATTPTFRTRLLDVSTGVPPADLLSPVLTDAGRWITERRDLVAFARAQGSATYPETLGALPALTAVGLPSGTASYGVGYARVAVLQLPPRQVPRIVVAASGTGQSLDIGGARVVLLGSSLLQVAVVVTADGTGFVLAGTLTSQAMNDLVRASIPALTAATAR